MKLVMLATRRRVVVHQTLDGAVTLCGRSVTNKHQTVIDEKTQPKRTCLVCEIRTIARDVRDIAMNKVEWESMTWSEFCVWIQGKRVVEDSGEDEYTHAQTLVFDDGSVAELSSEKTSGSPGYSEYTPGSDGHLKTPSIRVKKAV